ncbi:MAG: HNH endonuclease [Candidatus Omnitrophica bacterium]|nr:HNH endonuclease [Candidatus Omnitrophota bacterium]
MASTQKAFVAVTDYDWYRFLADLPNLDEVNFWQPGGSTRFQALQPGEPFLFKLHSPRNFIVGGGFFVQWSRLPLQLAWEVFEQKNGATSLAEMSDRIRKYRKGQGNGEIGCILLGSPFFLQEREWIRVPSDWKPNIVTGKGYSLLEGEGKKLWDEARARIAIRLIDTLPRYGKPTTILPRIGQGIFRVIVTDAYSRKCAVTGERVLPALEAAHIKPYATGGPHSINNGILLRSDLHRLFDKGYLTVTPDYRLDVSRRIREEFHNGREYYGFKGHALLLPQKTAEQPSADFLNWHNEEVFLS